MWRVAHAKTKNYTAELPMTTSLSLSSRLQNALSNTSNGVVGVVDELLKVSRDFALKLHWASGRCRVVAVEDGGSDHACEVALPRSVFRAILARVATVCGEQMATTVSPYGGEGELIIGDDKPPQVLRVVFVNTTDDQRLELSKARPPISSQEEPNKKANQPMSDQPFKIDVSARINRLPPYLFGRINKMKYDKRVSGIDIIDLGMGNPTDPTPANVVEKLKEAAIDPRNHRYSVSNGIAGLRKEVALKYKKLHGVDLNPETEVIATIGSKEGFSHLCLAMLGPAIQSSSGIPPSPSTSTPPPWPAPM